MNIMRPKRRESPKEVAEKLFQMYKEFNYDAYFNKPHIVGDFHLSKMFCSAYISGREDSAKTDEEQWYWNQVGNELVKL
jgi:hypothetical protein